MRGLKLLLAGCGLLFAATSSMAVARPRPVAPPVVMPTVYHASVATTPAELVTPEVSQPGTTPVVCVRRTTAAAISGAAMAIYLSTVAK